MLERNGNMVRSDTTSLMHEVRVVLDEKRSPYMPSQRLGAILEIILEYSGLTTDDHEPESIASHLPGVPGGPKSLDAWLQEHNKRVLTLSSQNERDHHTDASDLVEATAEFNHLPALRLARIVRVNAAQHPFTIQAQTALRMMHLEAAEAQSLARNT